MDILIVGNAGGTNVGASLLRAANKLGLSSRLCDARAATAGPRIASTLSWRLLGHRPVRLESFSGSVVEECRRLKPKVLVATGMAPLTRKSLEAIGRMGIRRINYSTDDPWNPGFKARWFLDALPSYDRIFSPRRSNMQDFSAHGCPRVDYLPFGYDEELWVASGPEQTVDKDTVLAANADVFFAGAAEKYRIQCVRLLAMSGIRVAVAGDYWHRAPDLRKFSLGHLSPAQLRAATSSVPVSLCFVRRANRDGHVMRSFEIPAIGGCMAAEDTDEHRDIFGADGTSVRYFRSPEEAVNVAGTLLADRRTREALSRNAHALIVNSASTYRDRLRSLLEMEHTEPMTQTLQTPACAGYSR